MTTDLRNTRTDDKTPNRAGEPHVVDTTTVPADGVAVYDRDTERTTDPAMRTTTTSPTADRVPTEPRSSGSVLAWIIGAVILIILAYFLLQFFF